jgi:hypothetical protein
MTMEDSRFDRLARLVASATNRRAVLATMAGFVPLAITGGRISAKSCAPSCSECEKCVNKTCRPVPDGRVCRRGRCRGGICRAGESECAVAAGGAAQIVTEAEFRNDTLRSLATVQPLEDGGGTRSRIDVTFAGDLVLAIETERSSGALTVVVTYGDAFRGIRRARLTDDGATVSGDIDGRAVVLPPGSSDPSQLRFVDGGPPPVIKVNPDLMDAVAALLRQAEQGAKECDAPQPEARVASARQRAAGKGRRGARRHRKTRRSRGHRSAAIRAEAHPEEDFACLALYVPCQTDLLSCEYGAVTGCVGSLFFYVACVLAATGICAVKAEQCRRAVRHNAPCCPVRCGGDAQGEIYGSDPSCCENGETCLDPGSNSSACCPPGQTGCDGECCPNGACIGGSCCKAPTGSVCGNQCCGGLDVCCGGDTCCTGSCIGRECCQSPSVACGRSCCRPGETCCNGVCCATGQVCDRPTQLCRNADPCPKRCINGLCCPEDKVCCGEFCVDVCPR